MNGGGNGNNSSSGGDNRWDMSPIPGPRPMPIQPRRSAITYPDYSPFSSQPPVVAQPHTSGAPSSSVALSVNDPAAGINPKASRPPFRTPTCRVMTFDACSPTAPRATGDVCTGISSHSQLIQTQSQPAAGTSNATGSTVPTTAPSTNQVLDTSLTTQEKNKSQSGASLTTPLLAA